jgi:hypothetical protein
MNYTTYKNEVLSKTDGSNIHHVRGLLSRVINGLSLIEYWSIKDKELANTEKINVEKAMKEIFIITNVFPEELEL